MQPNPTLIRTLTLLLALIGHTAYADNADNTLAELMLDSQSDESTQPALLLNTEISGEVDGMIATMTLTQVFQNSGENWVNGRYLFPLPKDAVIDSLTLTTGDSVLRGVIKEKEIAEQTFATAKAEGKKAGLLTQTRPNLFTMSLANIAPGAEVVTEITWVETVTYENGQFSLRLPTTFTPRYQPFINGDTTLPGTAHVSPDSAVDHTFTLNLDLAVGLPLDTIDSSTHDISVQSFGDSYQIELSNDTEQLDRDVIISWQPVAGFTPSTAVFSEFKEGDYYTYIMITPPLKNIISTLPKDVTFIIDTSGSMAGDSMEQAKEGLITGLDALSGQDLFNIVEFNSTASRLYEKAQPVNHNALRQAKQFVNQLAADGGTEMLTALELALSQSQNEGYLRQIIFITDGAVGNEQQLFAYLHKNLGDARLFTVGIGSAPNQHFMSGAAKYGRGTSVNIKDLNEVNDKITALFAKITRPMMRDITLDLPVNSHAEIYPQKIPDLYTAEPITVSVRTENPIAMIKLTGTLENDNWTKDIQINEAGAKNIHKIWARDKVADITEQSVLYGEPLDNFKDDIVAIGLANQIVTPYTAFVAVSDHVAKPTNTVAKDETVANLMPYNSSLYAPNTATSSTLRLLIGLLFLTLATAYYFKGFRQRNEAVL